MGIYIYKEPLLLLLGYGYSYIMVYNLIREMYKWC